MHTLETVVLNYTLIMDSAPGPHTGEEELLLSIKPNPVAVEVEEDSRTYITDSEDTITIIVRMHNIMKKMSFNSFIYYKIGKEFGCS